METKIKFAAVAFVVLIFIVVIFIPKNTASSYSFDNDNEADWLNIVSRLNEDLPRPIGTIGHLNQIRKEKDALHYYVSVKGDPAIINLYKDERETFQTIIMYALMTMNGQKNMGDSALVMMERYDIAIDFSVTCQTDSARIRVTAPMFREFLSTYRTSPVEARKRIIDIHVKIGSLEIPSVIDEFLTLTNIEHVGNSICLTYDADEKEYDIQNIRFMSGDPSLVDSFAKNISTDLDAKEVMKLLVIAHADLTISYVGRQSNKKATITIPYSVLKKYSGIPYDILKW